MRGRETNQAACPTLGKRRNVHESPQLCIRARLEAVGHWIAAVVSPAEPPKLDSPQKHVSNRGQTPSCECVEQPTPPGHNRGATFRESQGFCGLAWRIVRAFLRHPRALLSQTRKTHL